MCASAVSLQADILRKPMDLLYGQRHLMLHDPGGSAVDLSSPIH